jgi:hypothetical protein
MSLAHSGHPNLMPVNRQSALINSVTVSYAVAGKASYFGCRMTREKEKFDYKLVYYHHPNDRL